MFSQPRTLGALIGSLIAILAVPVAGQIQPALPEICQRGATAGPLPFDHVLQLEVLDYYATHAERTDYEAFAPQDPSDQKAVYEASILAQAIEWPGVLADRAAELPASAHDLPWLTLLAHAQTGAYDPVWALTQGPESILSADLPPLMERHGLTVEARLLRKAMALFPDWGLNPADRTGLVTSYETEEINEPLTAALDTISAHWPRVPNGAAEAALRLIRAEPALLAEFESRFASITKDERLDVVLEQLRAKCPIDWWDPESSDASLSALGSAQAGLMLLEALSLSLDGSSLTYWFEDYAAAHTDLVARLLDRRGEAELASALRLGVALFPKPYPRDIEIRWEQQAELDNAALDGLMPADGYERIRAVMISLASEAGLLPR